MKKMLSVLLISAMALAISSCGGKDKVGEASPPVQTPEAAAEAVETAKAGEDADAKQKDSKGQEEDKDGSLAEQAADAGTDAAEAGGGRGTAEDGQNPTMNFVGPYTADKAEMTVGASGQNDAEISVSLKSDANRESVWSMSGEFNGDTFSVEYSGGKKTAYEYADDGSVKSETVAYDDGTGRVIFNPQDGTCVWEDEKEHVADALIFEFNYPAAEVAETGELG